VLLEGRETVRAEWSIAYSVPDAFYKAHMVLPKRTVVTHFLELTIRCLRASFVVASLILVVLGFASRSESQVRTGRNGIKRARQPVPGRYLVVLRDTEDPEIAAAALQAMGRGRVRHVYRNAVRGFTVETSEAGARALAGDPGVAVVEEDGLVYTAGWQTLDAGDSWGLDRVDQRRIVGDLGLAYDGLYRYSGDGSGVNVYVVDTGIRTTHIEFGGRAIADFDGVGDGYGNGDCHGHGTHVAGTVGGARSGVAKGATLHSVRVFGCEGWAYFSVIAAAIDWVAANHVKPAVISMSIGGGQSEAVNAAIRGAIALGITVVGAAGNEYEDSCLHFMGGVPEALVVGASGYSDWRESYSNFGSCLDVFAPGGGITSAYAGSDTGFTTMSGTSMATPHVAGAAALFLEQKPDASPAQVVAAITGSATRGVIQDAGLGSPNRLLFTPHFGDKVAPTISLVEPRSATTVHGTQRLIAAAEDDVELSAVAFFAGGKHLRTDSTAPYSVEWDTTASPEGRLAVTAVAYDLAGNKTSARASIIVRNKRDRTPPHVTVAARPAQIRPGAHKLVPVTFTGTVSDGESLITSVTFRVHDEYGRVHPSGSASVTDGRFSITVLLEASRQGHDVDGRTYVLSATARDLEKNEASASTRVTVKHDNR